MNEWSHYIIKINKLKKISEYQIHLSIHLKIDSIYSTIQQVFCLFPIARFWEYYMYYIYFKRVYIPSTYGISPL
jgi:hypothetical protein